MNGDTESPDVRAERLDKQLQDYMGVKQIYPVPKPAAADAYMKATGEDMRAMSATELEEAAAILSQHAYYLQQEYNTARAKHAAMTDEFHKYIAPQLDNYGDRYMKYEMKVAAIVRGDTVAAKWREWQVFAERTMLTLENLSMHASNVARRFDTMHHDQVRNVNG